MDTQSVTTSSTTGLSRPRRARAADEGFGALLIGAQAASMQLNSVAITDATGLTPHDTGEAPDAQRARIDRETDAARQAEAQQSRPGAQRDAGDSRAESLRKTQGDRQATEVARSAPDKSSVAPLPRDPAVGANTPPPTTNEPPKEPASPANNPAPRPQDTRNAQSEKRSPAPSSKTVTVTTAGAARASTGANTPPDGSAARALGRMLAGRVETVRAPVQATVSPQTTRDGATSETAGKANRPAPQRAAHQRSEATRSHDAPQRSEFLKLIQSMRLNRGQRTSSATLRIEPPELGRMKVDVRMTGDTLHLRVEVASERARQVLSSRADELAAGLREHDIKVERFEVVTVGDPDAPEQFDEHAPSDAHDSSTGADPARRADHSIFADADEREDETLESAGRSGAVQDDLALLDVRA